MTRNSKRLVFGKGSKGDGVAGTHGKNTKAYATWRDMLRRCYDPKMLSKQPTYIGCSVCNEWLYFPNFQNWFDKNYVEYWQLDKDLLVTGNREYGPNTCVFVPQSINNLFTDSGNSRGDNPIGVSLDKRNGKFRTRLKIDGTQKHLGLFDSVDEAHRTYLLAKKENVIRVANEWKDKIPIKLYDALIRKANGLI